jgi:hypothetical protein
MRYLPPLGVRVCVHVRILHQEEQERRIEAGREGMCTWQVNPLYMWRTHLCRLVVAVVSNTKALDATVTPACQVLPGSAGRGVSTCGRGPGWERREERAGKE